MTDDDLRSHGFDPSSLPPTLPDESDPDFVIPEHPPRGMLDFDVQRDLDHPYETCFHLLVEGEIVASAWRSSRTRRATWMMFRARFGDPEPVTGVEPGASEFDALVGVTEALREADAARPRRIGLRASAEHLPWRHADTATPVRLAPEPELLAELLEHMRAV